MPEARLASELLDQDDRVSQRQRLRCCVGWWRGRTVESSGGMELQGVFRGTQGPLEEEESGCCCCWLVGEVGGGVVGAAYMGGGGCTSWLSAEL